MTRTFYWRQAKTAKFLCDVAYREAMNKERNDVECICYYCGTETVVDGAVEGLNWMNDHNRHRTYVRAHRRSSVSAPFGSEFGPDSIRTDDIHA